MTIRFSLTIAFERHQGIPEALEYQGVSEVIEHQGVSEAPEHQGVPAPAPSKSSQPRQLVFPWAED